MTKLTKRILTLGMVTVMGCFGSMVAMAADTEAQDSVAKSESIVYVMADEIENSSRAGYDTLWAPGYSITGEVWKDSIQINNGASLAFIVSSHVELNVRIDKLGQDTAHPGYSFYRGYKVSNTNGNAEIFKLGSGYSAGIYKVTVTPQGGGSYAFELAATY